MYLLVVRYRGDPERKRLEYLLEKFSGRLEAQRPGGAVLLVEAEPEVLEEFLEELYARIPPENVAVYRVAEADVKVGAQRVVLQASTAMTPQEAWGALGVIMARLKGALVSDLGGSKLYTVRVRGARVSVRLQVSPASGGSRITAVVEGYGPGVERVSRLLSSELGLLGEVVSRG